MSKKQQQHEEACPSCTFDAFAVRFDALPLDEQMPLLLEAWFGTYANETFLTHKLMALTADCAQRWLKAQQPPIKKKAATREALAA